MKNVVRGGREVGGEICGTSAFSASGQLQNCKLAVQLAASVHQLALAQAIAQLALATAKLHSTSTSSTSTQLDLFVTLKCEDLNGSKWTPRGN